MAMSAVVINTSAEMKYCTTARIPTSRPYLKIPFARTPVATSKTMSSMIGGRGTKTRKT